MESGHPSPERRLDGAQKMSGFAIGPLVALSLRTLRAHFETSIDNTA